MQQKECLLMRIIKKLAYNAILIATLASTAGTVAGFGTLIFGSGEMNRRKENKDAILEEYINSDSFFEDYTTLQDDLNKKRKHGLISTTENIKKLNDFSNKENIKQILLNSSSLIGEAYQKAVQDYETERNSLLTKSLTGIGCFIPALIGGAILDKINEKKNEEKLDEDITKNNAEYTK